MELSQDDSAAPIPQALRRWAGWGQSLSLEICSTVTLGGRKVLAAGQGAGRQGRQEVIFQVAPRILASAP